MKRFLPLLLEFLFPESWSCVASKILEVFDEHEVLHCSHISWDATVGETVVVNVGAHDSSVPAGITDWNGWEDEIVSKWSVEMSEGSIVGEYDSTSGVIELFMIVKVDNAIWGETGVFASSGNEKVMKA